MYGVLVLRDVCFVVQDNLQVAVKKIPLKSVPGKLSSIRQEEILILKVKGLEDASSGSPSSALLPPSHLISSLESSPPPLPPSSLAADFNGCQLW